MSFQACVPKIALKKINPNVSIKQSDLKQSSNQDSYHNQNISITTKPCILGDAEGRQKTGLNQKLHIWLARNQRACVRKHPARRFHPE